VEAFHRAFQVFETRKIHGIEVSIVVFVMLVYQICMPHLGNTKRLRQCRVVSWAGEVVFRSMRPFLAIRNYPHMYLPSFHQHASVSDVCVMLDDSV
jgi:hypothetical protein